MQKVMDFILSLFLPAKIGRFRTMSVLFAIAIFLLESYVLYFPYRQAILDQGPKIEEEYWIKPLKELPDNDDVKAFAQELNDLGCTVDANGKLVCSGLEDGDLYEKHLTFKPENGAYTKKLHFFIDYYIEKDPRVDLKEGFKSADYPYVENEEDYFLVLTPQFLYYQAYTMLTEAEKKDPVKHGDEALVGAAITLHYGIFKEFDLKVDEPAVSGYLIGDYLARKIVEGMVEAYASSSIINLFLIAFLFPLLFITIYWLVFKRTGKLRYFKEYYNIAAIASLVPLLIVFVIAWFLPDVINWYMFAFGLYYLFILYRVNNAREIEEPL